MVVSRGGKNNRFFDASRFSLERVRLDADKLIIGIKNIYFLPAATFCSPEMDHFRNFKIIEFIFSVNWPI